MQQALTTNDVHSTVSKWHYLLLLKHFLVCGGKLALKHALKYVSTLDTSVTTVFVGENVAFIIFPFATAFGPAIYPYGLQYTDKMRHGHWSTGNYLKIISYRFFAR